MATPSPPRSACRRGRGAAERRLSQPRRRARFPAQRRLHRQGRHRMRDAGAGRRARRLQRRVPRGRSRPEDRAGRALRDAGRRVPQRRLHSVEGAAARRRGDGRDRRRCAEHGVTFGAPQIDLDEAARLEGQGRRQADRRPRRHGQVAQGRCRARLSACSSIRITSKSKSPTVPGQDETGVKKVVKFAEGDHRGGLAVDAGCRSFPTIRAWSTRPARSLCAPFPKRMLVIGGGIIGLEMGTVYSTLGARLDVVEMLRRPDAGRRPRPRPRVGEDEQAALRPHHAEDARRSRVEAKKDALYVTFEGEQAPAGPQPYDLVLLAVGRSRRTARRSARTRPASRSPTAASSRSTTRCAPTCRTSSRSATSSASRCWRTRRCTKAMSRRKPRRARSRTSTRASFLRWRTPIRKSRGSA